LHGNREQTFLSKRNYLITLVNFMEICSLPELSGEGREERAGFLQEAMGCYLTEYWARVGIWAARFSHVSKNSQRAAREQGREEVIVCLGTMILSAATLAMLLVIGGVETNPGPVGESEKIMRVLRSGCDKILKSGTQCDTCGRWFHNSCGNVKIRVAESGKWAFDKCRTERLRALEEKPQDAVHRIYTLTRENKSLEEKLRLATEERKFGSSEKVQGHKKVVNA